MSVAGFKVINDNNVVQIDNNYSNIFFNRRFQLNTSNESKPTVVTSKSDEIVAIPVGVGLQNSVVLSDKFIDLGANGVGYVGRHNLLIFKDRPPSPPSAHNSGIEIYKNNGDLVFNSIDKPLKVIRSVTTTNSLDFTIDIPHNNIAVIPITPKITYVRGELRYTFCYISNNKLVCTHIKRGFLNPPWVDPVRVISSTCAFLVIDISDIKS